jgi:SAM-dependent methyltransferase
MNAVSQDQLDIHDAIPACPACGNGRQTDFFTARAAPVDVGTVLKDEADARAAPMADITLTYCHGCGLVRNRLFDSCHIAFRPGYDASLHHSARFGSYVDQLVDRLVLQFDLRDKDILEIGCGDGYFLRRLCGRGSNRGTGIDPTLSCTGTERVGAGRVEFIRDFYSQRYSERPCDFLCCQSVLEDIPRPLEFLSDVRDAASRRGAKVYFEVFHAGQAFEQQNTWSIHYEQCNYFGLESLQNLFQQSGFHVLEAGSCTGNEQYLFLEAQVAQKSSSREWPVQRTPAPMLPAEFANFAPVHRRRVRQWRQKVGSFCAGGNKVVVWGTGGKGVSFLNALGSESGIRFAVDINPQRQGRFVPGSAQQIVPPAFLTQWRPDAVILTNPAYETEIREQIAMLGIEPELWNACSEPLRECETAFQAL